METACSAACFWCYQACSIRVDVEDHVTGFVEFLWVWMGGTVVEEVVKCFHCCLGASVDFGSEVIKGMHGGVINGSCKMQEFATDLLESLFLGWCHGFRVVNCCHLDL